MESMTNMMHLQAKNYVDSIPLLCFFSFFDQGAVDIYNCAHSRVELCDFMHNGPTNVTKSQIYLGHSGGLSIGFNYESQISFNPYVHLSNCTFINNSVDAVNTELDEIVIRERIFPGRGGGASVIFNVVNAVSIMIESCYFRENFALGYGGGMYILPNGHTNHTVVVKNTKFINNKSQRGGGLHVGFIDPGALNRVVSVSTYNTEFIGNTALYGGGFDFAQSCELKFKLNIATKTCCMHILYEFVFSFHSNCWRSGRLWNS